MAERYTKTYVSVNVDIDEDGTMLPRLIRWMNGRVFAIEQLGYKCRASSTKVGGGGIRYTTCFRRAAGGSWRPGPETVEKLRFSDNLRFLIAVVLLDERETAPPSG